MYWCEHTFEPVIFSAYMDGSDIMPFFTENLEFPTSLAADPSSQRLFWADMKKHSVESVRFDGTMHMVVVDRSADPQLFLPVFIDVFENYVYGLMKYSGKVFKVSKLGNQLFVSFVIIITYYYFYFYY